MKSLTNRIRTYAGKIMAETSGDALRNEIASAFIETARQIEKIREPINRTAGKACFIGALVGASFGSIVPLLVILVLRLSTK